MGGCPVDILEWFEEMGLLRRVAALRKNASVAAADAVLVAEAIHVYYPKIVQMHSFVEQNNTPEDQIMRFASRQSEREVVEYLRELRIRLPSFEPLYLAEFHVNNDAASQQMSAARMMRSVPQRSHSICSEASSVLTDCTYETSSVASSMAPSTTSRRSDPKSPPSQPLGTNLSRHSTSVAAARRPSAAQSNKLLEKRKGREEAARRASLMSINDIEAQFQKLSGKLKRETVVIASETDELDRKSQTLDAQMAALQKQNQQELSKIEKRLSVLRLELQEAETGQSVVISDDINYTAMTDPGKNSFAREISTVLRESAMEVSSLEIARGIGKTTPSKEKNVVAATESRTNIPFGGIKSPVKRGDNLMDYDSDGSYYDEDCSACSGSDYESGSEYETDDSDAPPPPPPPPKVASSTKTSVAVNTHISQAPMTVSELENDTKPPTVPARLATECSIVKSVVSTPGNHHNLLHTEEEDNGEEEEEDSDEEAAFAALSAMRKASTSMRVSPSNAPGASPKPSTKSALKPTATSEDTEATIEPAHRRCFDKMKQRFYYVDLKTGVSKWRAPAEGVVLCTAKDGREYLFDVVTEKSTWKK